MQSESSEIATFLFTTIHGDPQPRAMISREGRLALAQHDRLVIETIESENGQVFKNGGSGLLRAVFTEPANAVRAALKAQMALQVLARSGGAYSLGARVRIALHSGVVEQFENVYSGTAIARLTALACAGHGGQILVSDSTQALVWDALPYEASLRDLGPHGLPDTPTPIRIWQLCHADLRSQFPDLNTCDLTVTNMPVPTTSFLGRKGDTARIRALIRAGRPVTLVGEPGIGKTRLANEIGFAELDAFTDGVWQVALEPVPETSCLAGEVAALLSIRQEPRIPVRESVVAYLRDKRLLLILDHCDHLIPACADLVKFLQMHCPHVAILATGSSCLGVDGERAYLVPPMALPPAPIGFDPATPVYALARYESVRLFLERARTRRPGFELTPILVVALCRLCLLVNGNALAIELAAAQAHKLSIEEMTEYIAASSAPTVADRPPELPATDPLSAMLDWSYALLTIKEKLLLLRLSVFAGGWEMDEAEAICADTPEAVATDPDLRVAAAEVAPLVEGLVDRALVRRFDSQPANRYCLPQIVLTYSLARRRRMREDMRTRARHCAYFFRLAQEASAPLASPERTAAEERLVRAGHNLRAALTEAVNEAGLPAISILPGAIERLLLFTAAMVSLCSKSGADDACRPSMAAALAAPGAHAAGTPRAGALLGAARIAWFDGDRKQAAACIDEALGIFRQLDNSGGVAQCLQLLAEFADEAGNRRNADIHRSAALSISREEETRQVEADTLDTDGSTEWVEGDLLFASQTGGEAIAARRQRSHDKTFAEALDAMSRAALDRGDLNAARACLGESLGLWRKLKNTRRTASAIESMAVLACTDNKLRWAASLYLLSGRLREEDDVPLSPMEQEERRITEDWIRARIDAVLFEEAEREDGRAGVDIVLADTYGPTLRIIEGGKLEASGVPTVREASLNP